MGKEMLPGRKLEEGEDSVTSLAGTYQYKECAQAWHKIRLSACSLCSTNEQDEQGMLALLDERAERAKKNLIKYIDLLNTTFL